MKRWLPLLGLAVACAGPSPVADDVGISEVPDAASDARFDVPDAPDAADAPADAVGGADRVEPPLPARETVVGAGARWRFRDDGVDLGTAWRAADHDDSGWREGVAQLGFGEGDEATVVSDGAGPTMRHPTLYFRRAFVLRGAASVTALTLRLLRDDGAEVYLNGREVHRANLPEGPVSHATLAPTTVGGADERTYFDAALDASALREGRNVIAVAVHQSSRDSSDLSFDLRLDVSRDPADAPEGDPVALAVGDAASCDWTGDEDTATLLDGLPGTNFALGDLAYVAGTETEFATCFHPTWGRHRSRMRPAPGNHDYGTASGAPYYRYFGERAGPAGRGYYSYELGRWHVVVLNSNCAAVGGCGPDSSQHRWLVADLARNPARCAAAYWHHPRFTSAPRGDSAFMAPLWRALFDGGVDVAFVGHEHHYERFAPMRDDGTRDDARGIRSFVVGTGGAPAYGFATVHAHSEVRASNALGALRLVLRPTGYDWRFVSVTRQSFSDRGSAECH